MEAYEVWNRIKERIKERIDEQGFKTWFEPTKGVSKADGVVFVEVPGAFFAEWIESRYKDVLDDLSKSEGVRIVFKTGNETKKREEKRVWVLETEVEGEEKTGLQQRYTFENFVVGESNRFANAASLAVAEMPGGAYNPLFIYGGVGLGKTHLLHAIGNRIRKTKPKLKVCYTSAERLFMELIEAIEKDTRMEFKSKYRSKDVLLIDDIHYLKGKESLQEEIFHTFNYLYSAEKQIVITSDRPPKEIPTLEERLVSRFQAGLVVDIQPPDLETRIAILNRKAEEEGKKIPQDVAYFIASRVKSNIRELEGCLVKLFALSSITQREITVEFAENVLKDILRYYPGVTLNQIIKEVSKVFGISPEEMRERKRTKELALARQVAMYLVRKYLKNRSLKEIASIFGKKDHTTVIHAVEKIEKLINSDLSFKEKIERIERRIRGG